MEPAKSLPRSSTVTDQGVSGIKKQSTRFKLPHMNGKKKDKTVGLNQVQPQQGAVPLSLLRKIHSSWYRWPWLNEMQNLTIFVAASS